MRSARFSLLLAALLAHPAVAAGRPPMAFFGDEPSWKPTRGQVRELERRVRLPQGADPLQTYERYYTGVFDQGQKAIYGVFVGLQAMPRTGSSQVVAAADIPLIADGGCGVLIVEYFPAS